MATSPEQNSIARANHALLVQFYDAVGRGELADPLDLVSDDVE